MDARVEKPLLERGLEKRLFAARWLMAPLYIGLTIVLAVLLAVFAKGFFAEILHVLAPDAAILMALSLIDVSLGAICF